MALNREQQRSMEMEGKAGRMARTGELGKQAANWGAQQAVEYVKDPGLYKNMTRAFAEARIAFVTRWFWLAEFATLGLLALFVVIDVLLWINNYPVWGLVALIPVGLSFLLWRLARYLRRLLYRQITRALEVFDDLLGKGVATISDWPRFFLDWRRKDKMKAS